MKRLMVYSYEQEHDLSTVNLGDYIQSIAANQFMNACSRESYFSRDDMGALRENDSAILNGWYRVEKKTHFLRYPMNVLPVSIHINNPEATEDIRAVVASWGRNSDGRIGCRDLATEKRLTELGFNAYFSSCLTTTLFYQFGRPSLSEREGVIFCDANLEKMFPVKHFFQFSRINRRRKVEKVLGEILSPYRCEPCEKVSHSCPVSMSHEERFALALNLLKKYSRAKLVVTSRIHCALPCIAMGTPVVLLVRKYDPLRYPGIDRFLNKIYLDSNDKLVVDLLLKGGMVHNNDRHISYAEKLVRECESFVRFSCDR